MPIKSPANKGTVISNADGLEAILDATLTDSKGQSFEITSDAIEDGSNVSSNIIEGPIEFSLTGFITRTPTFEEGEQSRLEKARDDLFRLGQAKKPVTVINGFNVLQNYAIERVDVSRSEADGQGASASMSFKQLTITTPITANLPPSNVDASLKDGATPTGDAGNQSPAESEGTATKAEVSKSIAAVGFDFLTGAN
jgi:hypothetical protein